MLRILRTIGLVVSIVLIVSGCENSNEPRKSWEWGASTEFGRQPRWSPDGAQILFGDDRSSSPGIYIWNVRGLPTLLTDSLQNHNWDYRWSPDGQSVAYSVPGRDGDSLTGIWITNVTGQSRQRIYDRGRDVSWLGDGSAIIARIDRPASGEAGVYSIPIDGGETSLVVVGGVRPLCAPGGSVIAYASRDVEGVLNLIDVSGGENRVVSTAGVAQWAWSANGQRLAFIVSRLSSGQILGNLRSVQFDGSREDSLTLWAAFPSPNFDGQTIAFLRQSSNRWSGLWIMSQQGEERIADFGLNPEFDPTGDRIAVNSSNGGIRILSRVN